MCTDPPNTVPKTYLRGGLHIPIEGPDAGTEPIRKRIIESPVDSYNTEFLRDPRSSFVACIPEGSIEKDAQLILTGKNGKTIQRAICHGPDINGISVISDIASRSPSYMVRQLNDIKQDTRKSEMAKLMITFVESLTSEDILNIVAYTAS